MLPLLLLSGCGPEGDSQLSPPTFSDPDGAGLAVTDEGTLAWTPAGQTPRALDFFLVEADNPDWEACSYDPWWLYDERAAAGTLAAADFAYDVAEACNKGLTFRASTTVAGGDGGYVVQFEGDRTARLSVDDAGPGLRLRLEPDGDGEGTPYVAVRVATDAGEEFYGLGETFDSIRHRGRVRPMQIEIDLDRESAYNEVHVPVPLVVSTHGWGLLADSLRPMVFDVAATDDAAVTVLAQQVGGLTFDLYAPPTPAQVTGRYWARTGAPEVPPDWAFAPLQWRNEVASESVVLDDARTLRDLDLPTGVLWVDNPWQSSYNSMQPEAARFPNWGAMVDELHGLGFRFMAWTTPYVEEDDPEHATYEANGWLVQGPQLFSQFGDIVDLTNPDATAAWAGRVDAARLAGIEGWKLDYGEDVQLGGFGARIQPSWQFDDGQDERTMHHGYARAYHTPYVTPYAEAGMLLGRGGVLGGHTVTDVIWPGDLDNGFERWNDERDDELLVGGLVSAIHGGTGLSVSGYPFFASDTGGYRGGRPKNEAFIRWMEYAALLPVWQYGGAGDNHNPWDFTAYGDSQFDESTLTAFRRYATLHTRLFPYYQALIARMLEEGVPVVLPQGLGDPAADVQSETDFFVGDALFVGTVVDEGATTWTGTLPTGDWVHWWTGQGYAGGTAVTVDAPLGEGPLFVREGSVVPMLRRSIETLAPATDPEVDSWADDPGVLNARVLPGAGASVTVADGAAVEASAADDVRLTAGSAYSGWDLEVHAPGATGASLDGVELSAGAEGCAGGCVVSVEAPWVRVVVPAGDHVVAVR